MPPNPAFADQSLAAPIRCAAIPRTEVARVLTDPDPGPGSTAHADDLSRLVREADPKHPAT
ncbi:hypothetical protein GCM10010275_12360 [Streptomyces litmocidini]|uniref:hypothetical protein n=1 Tax=Streptomyces litmocidini TaxID=67318 RepID=UPI00167F119F|nr:hypothetical protein [Streptomyces litmocidini]GGU79050.1 hypothetical protein GCM10010275_12360 [Streptomyces litmocidini]